MTILKGFPPSNTISPGPRIPDVVEIKTTVGELDNFDKFKTDSGEYMRMYKISNTIVAICYKSNCFHAHAGEIYGMSCDRQVIGLKNVYGVE